MYIATYKIQEGRRIFVDWEGYTNQSEGTQTNIPDVFYSSLLVPQPIKLRGIYEITSNGLLPVEELEVTPSILNLYMQKKINLINAEIDKNIEQVITPHYLTYLMHLSQTTNINLSELLTWLEQVNIYRNKLISDIYSSPSIDMIDNVKVEIRNLLNVPRIPLLGDLKPSKDVKSSNTLDSQVTIEPKSFVEVETKVSSDLLGGYIKQETKQTLSYNLDNGVETTRLIEPLSIWSELADGSVRSMYMVLHNYMPLDGVDTVKMTFNQTSVLKRITVNLSGDGDKCTIITPYQTETLVGRQVTFDIGMAPLSVELNTDSPYIGPVRIEATEIIYQEETKEINLASGTLSIDFKNNLLSYRVIDKDNNEKHKGSSSGVIEGLEVTVGDRLYIGFVGNDKIEISYHLNLSEAYMRSTHVEVEYDPSCNKLRLYNQTDNTLTGKLVLISG